MTRYIEFIRKEQSLGNNDFRELLEREKYREKKRENDVAERLLAPIEVLETALGKGVSAAIPVLESLPLILKRHFPELTGDQIQLVKQSIAECRNLIADVSIKLDD